MKETGSESSQKNKDVRKGGFDLLDPLHHIETLMMPMKIDGYDLRILLSDIIHDGKMWVFDPLHSQMDNLR
jgi:hypothetical protein